MKAWRTPMACSRPRSSRREFLKVAAGLSALVAGATAAEGAQAQPLRLTTQLYFPGDAANARDPIFSPELLMQVKDATDAKAATFDFVLDLGGGRAGRG